jgi:SpoVK/Ycf46/Vps4 family AAA+-type ATPase
VKDLRSFPVELAEFLKARFPYLYIPTWEEERLLDVVREVVRDPTRIRTVRDLFTWTVTDGMVGADSRMVSETQSPLKALEFINKYDHPAVFILKDFHFYFGGMAGRPDYPVIRKMRDLAVRLKQSPRPKNVIITAPTRVLPVELQKDVTIVEFDLPTEEEIARLLREMIEVNRRSGRIAIHLKPEEEERLVKAALGLTLKEAENAFARAMVRDGRVGAEDVEVILEEKRQIIKKTGILEFIRSPFSIDEVGGLENLKRWLEKRKNSWLDSAKRYNIPAPKGVLITGVPGCGKSLISKAISAMWKLPLLRLDIGKVFSGIVGSSEENMRQAIRTAEAIAPSILWIDEIEKGFSNIGSGGDSGTSTRVFGTFLTWMQEKTKPVFVVATANQIQELPPEFLRKGRFDEIFFVDLPTQVERKEIFRVHLRKRLRDPEVMRDFQLNEEVLETLAHWTEGFVGAEIEQVVITALFEAFSEQRSIRLSDFEKAVKNMVPLSVTQAEQIRAIRDWANVRAVAATAREHMVDYNRQSDRSCVPGDDDIRRVRGGRKVDF